MTGFGRAEVSKTGISARVEVRSVNSRFLEVTARLPRSLAQREKDIKEIARGLLNRGSLNVVVKVEKHVNGAAPLKVNTSAAKSYYKLLNDLRKAIKLREKVKLEHVLNFSEVLEASDEAENDEQEWSVVEEAFKEALRQLQEMRRKEGAELSRDLEQRIRLMDDAIEQIEKLSVERIPVEKKRLLERVTQLLTDKNIIDQNRLELEVSLLADKLDVTEECVRFRSHNKFFLEALKDESSAGRKLNFLVQEMNREANTIGSKANDSAMAHLVVRLKEELERIREQLQNIE
ncbi:MAG TPA: YicC/YloC family endoribonuclease [Bacteroidota bacterium]|nr:YicC/YloC family endoribonuclease [Bacteroidota bacterium]